MPMKRGSPRPIPGQASTSPQFMKQTLKRLSILGLCVLAACNTYPDKRLLQYLNTDGFGKRYTGNAEEENYITIGDRITVTDSFNIEIEDISRRVDIDGTVQLPELGATACAPGEPGRGACLCLPNLDVYASGERYQTIACWRATESPSAGGSSSA